MSYSQRFVPCQTKQFCPICIWQKGANLADAWPSRRYTALPSPRLTSQNRFVWPMRLILVSIDEANVRVSEYRGRGSDLFFGELDYLLPTGEQQALRAWELKSASYAWVSVVNRRINSQRSNTRQFGWMSPSMWNYYANVHLIGNYFYVHTDKVLSCDKNRYTVYKHLLRPGY